MAKATKRYEGKETVIVEKVLAGVTLELSVDEAEALVTLLSNCSIYGPLAQLWQELRNNGVEYGYEVDYPHGVIRIIKKV